MATKNGNVKHECPYKNLLCEFCGSDEHNVILCFEKAKEKYLMKPNDVPIEKRKKTAFKFLIDIFCINY